MKLKELLKNVEVLNILGKDDIEITGVNIALTSYTMRHSWASLAYKSNVPLSVISQALGHTRPDTTMIYIRSLDNAQMQESNNKVQRLIADYC